MLSEHESLAREHHSLEFEKALRNVNIPKQENIGLIFSSPYGLKGLENFEEVIDLGNYESPEEALARFLPNCRTYYDVMLVY
jgi:hypothetical protein